MNGTHKIYKNIFNPKSTRKLYRFFLKMSRIEVNTLNNEYNGTFKRIGYTLI